VCVIICIQLRKKKGQRTEKKKKQFTSLQYIEKSNKNSFMRGGGKQHYSWKLDDERRKRSATSSLQASPITTHSGSPANYTHENTHTGIIY
jgi:hypothetical protein